MNKLCIFDLSMKFIFFEMSPNMGMNFRLTLRRSQIGENKKELRENSLFIKLRFLDNLGEMTRTYCDASKFHSSLLFCRRRLKVLSLSFIYLHIFHNLKPTGFLSLSRNQMTKSSSGIKAIYLVIFSDSQKINYRGGGKKHPSQGE